VHPPGRNDPDPRLAGLRLPHVSRRLPQLRRPRVDRAQSNRRRRRARRHPLVRAAKTAGHPWTIHQQQTYAPDGDWRWMGKHSPWTARATSPWASACRTARTCSPPCATSGAWPATRSTPWPAPRPPCVDGAGARTDGMSLWSDWSQLTVEPHRRLHVLALRPIPDLAGERSDQQLEQPGSAPFKFAECPAPLPVDTAAATAASAPPAADLPRDSPLPGRRRLVASFQDWLASSSG